MSPTMSMSTTVSATPPAPADGAMAGAHELLTISLAGELFGIEVVRVQEILDIVPVTAVPNADPFAPGVINVRGHVVPLIDLRHRFGLPPAPDGASGRTVVFEVQLEDERTRVAMTVDAVRDVLSVAPDRLEDIPEIGTRWNRAYVAGITRLDGELLIVLDAESVFAGF